MAARLALISAVLFALAATLQQLGQFVLARKGKEVKGLAELFRPTWHVFVAIAALLAALAGATIITLANRETQMPDEAAADDGARPYAALA